MGLHTWFYKDKQLFEQTQLLYEQCEKHAHNEIYLDDMELRQINHEIDMLCEQNDAGYHDIFRTTKRNSDQTYTSDIIYSKKECDDWLEDNSSTIYNMYKDLLYKFWSEYPDGVIEFL